MNIDMAVLLINRLMTCSAAIIVITVLVMGAKYLLKRHLSPRSHYLLWFPFLFLLIVPFMPIHFEFSDLFSFWINSLKSANQGLVPDQITVPTALSGISGNFLNDFTVSVSRQAPAGFYRILMVVWILGVLVMSALTIRSNLIINRLRHASLPLQNPDVRVIFDECRQELNIKKDIPLLSTVYLKTPATVGAVRPCIMLPISITDEMAPDELRFVLMHELVHCKYRDTLINLFVCLAQIVYWFHPLVWFAARQLRSDGESACDDTVLSRLKPADYIPYGNTLLKFAARISGLSLTGAACLGGQAKELRKRILSIKAYRHKTRQDQVKGAAALLLITAMTGTLVPSITASADLGDHYDHRPDHVVTADLSSYFEGYNGTFVLYDTNMDQYHIYNETAALTRVSPMSTYKIYIALTALQAGVITPDATTARWDATKYPYDEWNQDQTLSSAMKNSVTWYFLDLDQASGRDMVQQSLRDLNYGNQSFAGGMDRYWLESSLKISPLEQVELLSAFDAGTLPYAAENIAAVKDAMQLSSSGSASLYGKTGTGVVDHKEINGWFIGVVKDTSNTYVFAVNIQGDDHADGPAAARIALNILKDQGIYYE